MKPTAVKITLSGFEKISLAYKRFPLRNIKMSKHNKSANLGSFVQLRQFLKGVLSLWLSWLAFFLLKSLWQRPINVNIPLGKYSWAKWDNWGRRFNFLKYFLEFQIRQSDSFKKIPLQTKSLQQNYAYSELLWIVHFPWWNKV